MSAPEPLFGLDRDTLRERVTAWGMPVFRADQILKWVYERGITDLDAMTDLSKADRSTLSQKLNFATLESARDQQASDGTRKLLLALTDVGKPAPTTECVMIPAENSSGGMRRTACVSSQVGCPVGCRFCASGLGGLERNLTTAQIVEQVWRLGRLCPKPDGTGGITNVVFMGMGEPLSNFSAVTAAIRTLNAPWGLNISARRITVSTVGVPAQIRRLADQIDLPITLAISLHAPDDTLRRLADSLGRRHQH